MIVFQFFFFYKLTGGDCKPNFDLEYKYICTNFESVKDNIVWQKICPSVTQNVLLMDF